MCVLNIAHYLPILQLIGPFFVYTCDRLHEVAKSGAQSGTHFFKINFATEVLVIRKGK